MEKALLKRHFVNLLDTTATKKCQQAKIEYLKEIVSLDPNTGIPYNKIPSNPPSIFDSAYILSTLLDLEEEQNELTCKLLNWMLQSQTKDGWWKDNSDLLKLSNLEPWRKPDNASVKIFNTCAVAAILSRISIFDVSEAINKAMRRIEQVTSKNGAVFGFPQSTWVVTPAIKHRYGPSNHRFNQHLSLLNEFIKKSQPITNIITITRSLLYANIDHDNPLLEKCINMIRKAYIIYDTNVGGWIDEKGNINTLTTAGALHVLKISNQNEKD